MEDMERVERVEQLVQKAGCSYTEAKNALERNDWNLLDALIDLEEKNATFVESEVIDREDAHRYQSADFNMNPNEKHFKDIGNDAAGGQKTGPGRGGKVKAFFRRLWEVITGNYLNIYNKDERQILHVPVIIPVILFLINFWIMMVLCVVLLLIGFRFQFEGVDLGKSNINNAMNTAAEATYNAGQKVKAEFSTPQNSNPQGEEHNGSYSDSAANGQQ